jgi:hypothetical protein
LVLGGGGGGGLGGLGDVGCKRLLGKNPS